MGRDGEREGGYPLINTLLHQITAESGVRARPQGRGDIFRQWRAQRGSCALRELRVRVSTGFRPRVHVRCIPGPGRSPPAAAPSSGTQPPLTEGGLQVQQVCSRSSSSSSCRLFLSQRAPRGEQE